MFITGAYESNSKAISAQASVNCYVEADPSAANQLALVGLHGTTEFSGFSDVRALHVAWGELYVVEGSCLYLVGPMGEKTLLGEVGSDGNPASLAHNINNMLIVSAGQGYSLEKGAASVVLQDVPSTSRIDFVDGYVLLAEKESGRFRYTELDSVELSGFATAEGSPDDLVSLVVDHREVMLFGESTLERWYNDGATPFARSPGGFVERGCKGAFSPAKLDNTVFWLGDDLVVYRLDDHRPIRISNHGIENLIAATTVDPIGMAYSWNGHAFYQLHFPGQLSCVYDASTKLWHTREQKDRKDAPYYHYAQAYGKNFVGGRGLFEIREDLYTHAGEEIPIQKSVGPLRVENYGTMPRLTLIMDTGENSNPNTDSLVFLKISDDSGRTFSGRIEGSIGKQGDYRQEVTFYALGGFYDNQRVLEINRTDDAKFVLVDSYAN